MPMTKAEKARVEELETSISLLRALAWPQYPSPAPMTKSDIDANLIDGGLRYGRAQKVCRGWFANSYNLRVGHGCSDGVNHSWEGDTTSTQGTGRMFWTEIDAWKAIRHALTLDCAEKLAQVDQNIARTQQESKDA